jgi:hypothetical protein
MPKVYVPDIVVKELDIILKEQDLHSKAEGFRKMAKYSRAGRVIEQKISTKSEMSLTDIVPEIPIGKVKPKKQNIHDILGI